MKNLTILSVVILAAALVIISGSFYPLGAQTIFVCYHNKGGNHLRVVNDCSMCKTNESCASMQSAPTVSSVPFQYYLACFNVGTCYCNKDAATGLTNSLVSAGVVCNPGSWLESSFPLLGAGYAPIGWTAGCVDSSTNLPSNAYVVDLVCDRSASY